METDNGKIGKLPAARSSTEVSNTSFSNAPDTTTGISPIAIAPNAPNNTTTTANASTTTKTEYKVYKRRFFGLFQLTLLNIVVSWDWLSFAPVSQTAAQYFSTSEAVINWFSTAFLLAFVVALPFTNWALSGHGPKVSIMISSVLLLVGNWVKYGGVRANSIGVTMLGQLVIGLSQPFVLSAPTSYSNLWFSPSGRTAATALASLSNPFGGALGQLITPFWVNNEPSQIPSSILYVSIVSSVACVPSFFIPPRPPTPPSAAAARIRASPMSATTARSTLSTLWSDLVALLGSVEFYLIFIPYSVFVGLVNAISSLLNQLLEPYGFSEDNAGIAGAILIVVGLVVAAISSPLLDKYKLFLPFIRVVVPMLAVSFLVFTWAPATGSLAFVFVMCALIGATGFSLVPVALEFLVEIHYPLGPELSSSLCWGGGQFLGGIFIVIMTALRAGDQASPPENMTHSLWFQAILAMLAMPLPLCLGLFGRREFVRIKRTELENEAVVTEDVVVANVVNGGGDGAMDLEQCQGQGRIQHQQSVLQDVR